MATNNLLPDLEPREGEPLAERLAYVLALLRGLALITPTEAQTIRRRIEKRFPEES